MFAVTAISVRFIGTEELESIAADTIVCFSALIIKRCIDPLLIPQTPPSQDAVPISSRIYLSPTMALGCYHSQRKEGKRAPETRGGIRGEMVLFVFQRQHTNGWAISRQSITVQTCY